MPISWNEIRQNAIRFAAEWAAQKREPEKQTFWDEFFEVFGMRRRAVASFEEPVKQISGTYGRIDLFWKGMLLVEHKSRGQHLARPSPGLPVHPGPAQRGTPGQVPRYVIVSDFARFALHDLEPEDDTLPLFPGTGSRRLNLGWPICTAIFTLSPLSPATSSTASGSRPDQSEGGRHHGRLARRPGGGRLCGPRS